MRRGWGSGLLVASLACAPAPPAPAESTAPAPEHEPGRSGQTAAAIVLFNPLDVEITPYGGYVVSLDGSSGTRQLWPHPSDCPGVHPKLPAIAANDGRLALDPPTHTYGLSGCEATPLPDGRYVIRIDSGYTADLYAASVITVPMTVPIEMAFVDRTEAPWRCDDAMAQRAATLAVAAARAEGRLPDGFLDGCDLTKARCVASAQAPAMPPERCTVTLSQGWLRIERPAGGDAPRSLTASIDREAVYARMVDVNRTSAGVVPLEGETLVIAGETTHERHEHGGDAAKIGSVRLTVDNPLSRPVRYRVVRVEFLTGHSCGLPTEVAARPKVTSNVPAEIPPGRSTIAIGFAPQDAYQAWCDRFATRVTLKVEGRAVSVSSEHEVARYEPMREF